MGGGHRSFEPSHPDSQPRGSASFLGEVPFAHAWTRCQTHLLLGLPYLPAWCSGLSCQPCTPGQPEHFCCASTLRNVLRSGLEPSPSGPLSNPAPPSDQPSGRSLTTPPSDAGSLAVLSRGLLPRQDSTDACLPTHGPWVQIQTLPSQAVWPSANGLTF